VPRRVAISSALAAVAALLCACDDLYPEVVIVNEIAPEILVKDASFSGCAWPEVLAYGDATRPGRCLAGEDRVHFEKLDIGAYVDESASDAGVDSGLVADDVLWFNYQTVSAHRVDRGDFAVFTLTRDDMEQDFSVPGPYGH